MFYAQDNFELYKQKPVDLKTKAGNWYTCDMEVMNENMVTAFHRDEIYYCPKDGYLDVGGALFKVGCLDVFRLATEKEIRQPQPKQERSEEDETYLNHIVTAVKNYYTDYEGKENPFREPLLDWLKSLRPQNRWKPSDEQLRELRCVISGCSFETPILVQLEEDLKKLL